MIHHPSSKQWLVSPCKIETHVLCSSLSYGKAQTSAGPPPPCKDYAAALTRVYVDTEKMELLRFFLTARAMIVLIMDSRNSMSTSSLSSMWLMFDERNRMTEAERSSKRVFFNIFCERDVKTNLNKNA